MTDKEFTYEFLKSLEDDGRTLKEYIQTLVAENKLFKKVIYNFIKGTSILWGNHSDTLDNQIPEEYKITEEEKEAVDKLILSIEDEIRKESTKKDSLILCPKCGKSHYEIGPTYSTLVYCPTLVKDGKVISEDLNISTTELICKECGYRFTTNGSRLAFDVNNGSVPY